MNGGSAVTFFTNQIVIFIEIMYNLFIRQAENDIDASMHVFGIRDIEYFYSLKCVFY